MQKVSILVAVYNSEPYLRQCLESLIAQTYSDIQIICVDDASTDDSWNLLQEYSEAVLNCNPCSDGDGNKRWEKTLALLPEEFTPLQEEETYVKLLNAACYVAGMSDTYSTSLYRKLRGIQIR